MTKTRIIDWDKWNIMHGKDLWRRQVWYVFKPESRKYWSDFPYSQFSSWREAMDYVIKEAHL